MSTKVNYKNLTFNFTAAVDTEEFSGESCYEIDRSVAVDVLNHLELNDIETNQLDELKESLGYSEGGHTLCFNSADLFLCLASYLVEEFSDGNYEISCEYADIIWLFHDIAHIENDCGGFDVNVYNYAEESAIKSSIDKLVEHKLSIPYSILSRTNKEYKDRFNSSYDFVEYAESLNEDDSLSVINY